MGGKISSRAEFSEKRILKQTNRISGAQPRTWYPSEDKEFPLKSVLPPGACGAHATGLSLLEVTLKATTLIQGRKHPARGH